MPEAKKARYVQRSEYASIHGLSAKTVHDWLSLIDSTTLRASGILRTPAPKQPRYLIPSDLAPQALIDAVNATLAKSAA